MNSIIIIYDSVKEVNLSELEIKTWTSTLVDTCHQSPNVLDFTIYPHSFEDGSIAETCQLPEKGGFGQEVSKNIIKDDSEKEMKLERWTPLFWRLTVPWKDLQFLLNLNQLILKEEFWVMLEETLYWGRFLWCNFGLWENQIWDHKVVFTK